MEITLINGEDAVHAGIDRNAAKTEIELFSSELSAFGLSLSDIADNCPPAGTHPKSLPQSAGLC